jgi:hypothetical protein
MANKNLPELSDFFIEGRPLWRAVFEKPEHVTDVLKYLGLQRRSTLRKIIHELDMMAINYRIALKNKPPKFEEADPILERFENSLHKTKKQWLDDKLRPLHPAFIALRIKMIRRSERKQKVDAAMASINIDLVATTLLRVIRKLRVPKEYALCGFHIHHCLGELLNGVDASISHDHDNRKSPSKKFRRCLHCFIAGSRYDLLDPLRLPRLSLHDENHLAAPTLGPALELKTADWAKEFQQTKHPWLHRDAVLARS